MGRLARGGLFVWMGIGHCLPKIDADFDSKAVVGFRLLEKKRIQKTGKPYVVDVGAGKVVAPTPPSNLPSTTEPPVFDR